MMITLNYSAIDIGPSQGNRLLLELSTNSNPFTYINDSSVSNPVECICRAEPSNLEVFSQCVYRPSTNTNMPPANTFMPAAIVIDLEIKRYLSARCYFPEWRLYAGNFFMTAKVVNDEGGVSTNNTNYLAYGGYFHQISNTISISSVSPGLQSLSLVEFASPTVYSPWTTTHTYLDSYSLSATFSSSSSQPIIYIDFQKAGIVPDTKFCNKTFFIQCRVYSRLRHILVGQYLASWSSSSTLVIDSNYQFRVYLPSHQEAGVDADYALIMRVISDPTNQAFTHKSSKLRTLSSLVPTSIDVSIFP